MNKYIVVTLVMVVLLVALAEIYLALSMDQHLQGGRWNVTINWTIKALPETPDDHGRLWPHFFYSTQTSSKTTLKSTVLNFRKIINLNETAEFNPLSVSIKEAITKFPIEINDTLLGNAMALHEHRT